MESTIEKVAKAIMTARNDGGCQVVDWKAEEVDNPHVSQAIRQARAAIEAMREPAEEQLRAAWDKVDSNIDDFWRAMVDAALNEEVA